MISYSLGQFFTIYFIGYQIDESNKRAIKASVYPKKEKIITEVGNDLIDLVEKITFLYGKRMMMCIGMWTSWTERDFTRGEHSYSYSFITRHERFEKDMNDFFDRSMEIYNFCRKTIIKLQLNDIRGSEELIKKLYSIGEETHELVLNQWDFKRSLEKLKSLVESDMNEYGRDLHDTLEKKNLRDDIDNKIFTKIDMLKIADELNQQLNILSNLRKANE
ncbi:hypothetical protein [Apilactobacillus micheneri]|uniref:hypothetical protein n=1 Tax=Apilactobacillus micheneri TaxID=1899430 RepID=UPI0015E8741C|nr:hypothetical protein [Apilactobacillus micheneri]